MECTYDVTELDYLGAECTVYCDENGPYYYVTTTFQNTGNVTITDFCAEWNVIGGQENIQCFNVSLEPGETVELVAFSAGGSTGSWFVVVDGRIPCKGKLRKTDTQTVSTATDTQVQFNTEDYDIGDCMSTSTYDFTAKRAGKYKAKASASIANLSDSNRCRAQISINDTIVDGTNFFLGSGGFGMAECVSSLDLSVGDTVEVYVEHNYGSDRSTSALSNLWIPKLMVEEKL